MSPRHITRVFTALLALAACGDDTGTNALPSELQQLKTATTPYQSLATAQAAGYDTPITNCWYDHNQGGMGYHYGRVDLIDGRPDLMHPEVLIYEPQRDGSMLLVGMEYLVPIDAWSSSEPPRLVDQDFSRSDALGVYALHIYLWKNNPDGMFAPWNPEISCQYADDAADQALQGAPATHAVAGTGADHQSSKRSASR